MTHSGLRVEHGGLLRSGGAHFKEPLYIPFFKANIVLNLDPLAVRKAGYKTQGDRAKVAILSAKTEFGENSRKWEKTRAFIFLWEKVISDS